MDAFRSDLLSQHGSAEGKSVYSYLSYGLGIHSVLSLPELEAAKTPADDVRVYLGRVDRSPTDVIAGNGRFCGIPGEVCLFYEEVGAFLVRKGREIIVQPTPGVEERVIRLCILGPVMTVLLHQRGLLVLHGSAVAVHGRAIVFLGEPGQGKSTTAATMHVRGHGIIADDAVAVNLSETRGLMVVPGFPQLKLWPDAVVSLGEIPEALPQVHPKFAKRARHVHEGFSRTPLLLHRVYVLAEGPRQEIEPLTPREGFLELVRHSKAARFAPLMEATNTASPHFRQCARVATSVPIARLTRPRSLPALPSVANLIENALAEPACSSGLWTTAANGV